MIKSNIPKELKSVVQEFQAETEGTLVYLFKSGSKLYGTDTSESDTDYKGIFIPSRKSVLLKQDVLHWKHNTNDKDKNTADDIDFQVDSIYKFFDELKKGETGALDTLFSMFQETSHCYVDTEFVGTCTKNYERFYNKNLNSFVGYCVGQSKKYGVKGLRYNELKLFNVHFERFQRNISSDKMQEHWTELKEMIESLNFKYINFVFADGPKTQTEPKKLEYLEVLGSKYSPSTTFDYVCELTHKTESQFGDRTKQASKGTDWKALSHAVRVILEVEELLCNNFITFPLIEAEYVKNVKTEKMPLEEVVSFIDAKLDLVNNALLNNTLPDKSDEEFMKEVLLKWVI